MKQQYPISSERIHFSEGTALQKLVLPLQSQETVENAVVSDDLPFQVLDNNPFYKRKLDQIQFDTFKIIGRQ